MTQQAPVRTAREVLIGAATTASVTGPSANQCSVAPSMEAATHWKATSSSSMRVTGRYRSTTSRSGALDSRWVR